MMALTRRAMLKGAGVAGAFALLSLPLLPQGQGRMLYLKDGRPWGDDGPRFLEMRFVDPLTDEDVDRLLKAGAVWA